MDQLILFLQAEFETIGNAFFTFATAGVMIATIAWGLGRKQSDEKVSNLESRIQLRDDRIAEYERKLAGASPDEAAALVASLEQKIAAFEGGMHDLIRQTFAEMITAEMASPYSMSFIKQVQRAAQDGFPASKHMSLAIDDYTDLPASNFLLKDGEFDMPETQALLLEAGSDGQGGATPITGAVEWDTRSDEKGQLLITGKVVIRPREFFVSVRIQRNYDESLPTSHLMEVEFEDINAPNGAIAHLAGVLLKDDMLTPGAALSGASAQSVPNAFLFALSKDVAANKYLLERKRWFDIAFTYENGRNAILTLEKTGITQIWFRNLASD